MLKSLNFQIQSRRFTAIIGPTASGKSTLLQSLIGETVALDGQTERDFSTAAYCSQVPSLTNGSLQDNIIGGSPLDETWYSSVVHACVLQDDIVRLSHGDLTKVGSNGVNLSGGQRQRVVSLSPPSLSVCLVVCSWKCCDTVWNQSLARALYSRCKLVLLDDTFSGLDVHTVKLLAKRLFGPQGYSFATRPLSLLPLIHVREWSLWKMI